MNRFEGRVAIITGGGGDIASCIALKLGSEGAKILLVEKNRDRGSACINDLTQKARAKHSSRKSYTQCPSTYNRMWQGSGPRTMDKHANV